MEWVNGREMSVIETPPQERLPIRTFIRHSEDALIREAILREIDRGGQAFFLHNRVQELQAIAQKLRKPLPEATFAVGRREMAEDPPQHVLTVLATRHFN